MIYWSLEVNPGDQVRRVKTKLLILLLAVLLAMVAIAGTCVQRLLAPAPPAIWTPAPVSGAPILATRPAEILPTVASQPLAATAARSAPPTASPVPPSATPLPAPAPLDPNLVVITEADVMAAITGGGTAGSGLMVEGLAVRFTDGRMTLQAANLNHNGIRIQNLTLIGRLAAADGKLELVTESIAPRGLVTALVPIVANQALAQYTAQWYIEEVRTLEGRLELRVR